MRHTYFSTFITGFHSMIEGVVHRLLKQVIVLSLADGLLVFQTEQSIADIRRLKIFNNTFLLLEQYNSTTIVGAAKVWLRHLRTDCVVQQSLQQLQAKTFRIVVSHANQLTTLPPYLHNQLVCKLKRAYCLSEHRSSPDVEFWLLLRSEQVTYVGLRLTQHCSISKTLSAGALRSELAHLLCWFSDPTEQDLFCDPFCGTGAIPLARQELMGYQQLIASDVDQNKIKRLQQHPQVCYGKGMYVDCHDFFNIDWASQCVDRLVTDPPWGVFAKLSDPQQFYALFLRQSYFLLRPSGILVFLTSQQEVVDNLLTKGDQPLRILQKLNILVSGKKAIVYKIMK